MNAGPNRSSYTSRTSANPTSPTSPASSASPSQGHAARPPQRTSEPIEPSEAEATHEPRSAPPARQGRAPTHVAYHVRELAGRKEKKAIWTRIGSAWPHHDGNGFNIQIEVVPLDGKITLRVAEDRRDT